MLVLCALSVFAGTSQAVTLFSDGFESGDFTAGGWIKTSVWPLVDAASAHTGSYGAGLYMTTSGIAKAQSTVGYSSIHVKYWRKTTQSSSSETFYVDWSADGGTNWTNLETVNGTTSWAYSDKTCGSGANNNVNFRVRFRNASGGGTTNDVARVDDVLITGSLPQYTISGTVTSGGTGLDGVTMNGLPGNPVTSGGGLYTATVDSGWNGTVTPAKTGYTFSPASQTYTNVTSNQTQNYTATPSLPVPGKATSPSPATITTNVGVTTDLNWTAGSDATSHDVYFGTVTPPVTKVSDSQAGTTWDTGTMANNTTYYWRIDEKNASGTTTGDIWSFTTKAQVPSVLNMTEAAATTAITGAGLVKGTVTQECSNTVAAGNVISQTPAGNTQVDVGSSVNLVISTGQPSVPDVTGQTEAAAIAAIGAVANISYGSSTTECSDTVAAGSVISQSATGAVSCGTVVNLVVSSGQPSVPNVVGSTEAAAIAAIGAVANISYGSSTTECSDTVAAGSVISQSATGAVSCGTVVNLVVSSGQPSVPNVVGSTEAAAIAVIGAVANISYGSSSTECSDTVAAGSVISQSATGTVPCGTVVNLVISSGPCLQTISGYVTEPDANIPGEGVLVDANNNGGGTDTTDANGYYEVVVPYGWSGTATPIKEGYTFEPNSIAYTNVVADEVNDYTATLKTFNISGYVLGLDLITPISDVNVSAENGGGPWTTKYGGGSGITDANGYYKVTVDYNWPGKVTPAKYAYAFEPNSIAYTNVVADQNDRNYTGKLLSFAISGYIRNDCDVPIKDVLVSADNGGNAVTTDSNGYYEVWVPYNWSGTVTPGKLYYTFTPVDKAYINVLSDQMNQNYLATNIYDLDCNGFIGYGDLAIMCGNWLSSTPGALGNLNGDDIVNFLDFAEFAEVW